MIRSAVAALLLSSAVPATAQPTATSPPVPGRTGIASPRAIELFEGDWVLMDWALRLYHANGDVLLSPAEARTAANAFRDMADANRDGRVTPAEYRAARAFILARY